MWFLDTRTAELHLFESPESVPGGYAVLSHVWDKEQEQTFQEIRGLQTKNDTPTRWTTRSDSGGISHRVAHKIREFCKIAKAYGYQWAWADTCCIDKTSSAELSEAINSMFRYYRLSDVCFVYLRDVHPGTRSPWGFDPKQFQNSEWHTRGWALQELLAPRLVVFLAEDWSVIGTKASLTPLLQESTGIPIKVLRFEVDIAHVSVAQRMSWASKRRTTRPEDEAYCLMGIFGINMPALYGEGDKAFYRLQEEIMKTCADTSLFAWGNHEPYTPGSSISFRPPRDDTTGRFTTAQFLFASSPRSFASCRDIVFEPEGIRGEKGVVWVS